MLVLGLESGVRGILGLEVKALSYSRKGTFILVGSILAWPVSLLRAFPTLAGLSSLVPLFDVGLGPDLDFDEVVGRLCCCGARLMAAVVDWSEVSLAAIPGT